MRRWLAIAAFVGTIGSVLGCSMLVNLDGLAGGGCSGACIDAAPGADEASLPDPSGTLSTFADSGRALLDSPTGGGSDEGAPPSVADGSSRSIVDSAPSSDPNPPLDSSTPDPTPAPLDAAPCTPATLPSLDVCTGVGAMPASPVIDGVLDCGVPLWPMPIVASSGPGAIPSSVQASIGAAWRPDGLYLFVRVTGAGATRTPAPAADPAWCGDAIELFVDETGVFPNAPAYNDPGTIQLVAVAPASAAEPASVGEMFRSETDLGPWKGDFVSLATSDGFTTEAFVTAADLGLASWSLSAGGKIGLDVALDLGSPAEPASCPRLAQFTIQIPQGTNGGCAAACDVREFCTPALD
jgi:hypothetical protein